MQKEQLAEWLYNNFSETSAVISWKQAYKPLKDWYRGRAGELLGLL